MNVLSISLPNLILAKDDDVVNNVEVQEAMQKLTDPGITLCKEISSSSHIAYWRNMINTVWLHK